MCVAQHSRVGRRILLVLALWFFAFGLCAQNVPTNDVKIATTPEILTPPLLDLPTRDYGFVALFNREMAESSTVFPDSFGGASELGWTFQLDNSRYSAFANIGRSGRDAFRSMFSRTFRETALNWLPTRDWEDSVEAYFHVPVVNLFVNSVGNTREEALIPLADGVTLAEQDWVRQARPNRWEYGLRVDRPSPYAYLNTAFGDYQGSPILLVDARWQFNPMRRSDQFSLQAVLPLFYGWDMRGSFIMDPLPMRHEGRQLQYSAGFAKTIANWALSFGAAGGDGWGVGCVAQLQMRF
jgi:hypothetical protein